MKNHLKRGNRWHILIMSLIMGVCVSAVGCAELSEVILGDGNGLEAEEGSQPLSSEEFRTQQQRMMQQRMLQDRPAIIGPGAR